MTSSKNKFGNKCTCALCNATFYDLGKELPQCPKCGRVYTPPVPVAPKVKRRL